MRWMEKRLPWQCGGQRCRVRLSVWYWWCTPGLGAGAGTAQHLCSVPKGRAKYALGYLLVIRNGGEWLITPDGVRGTVLGWRNGLERTS